MFRGLTIFVFLLIVTCMVTGDSCDDCNKYIDNLAKECLTRTNDHNKNEIKICQNQQNCDFLKDIKEKLVKAPCKPLEFLKKKNLCDNVGPCKQQEKITTETIPIQLQDNVSVRLINLDPISVLYGKAFEWMKDFDLSLCDDCKSFYKVLLDLVNLDLAFYPFTERFVPLRICQKVQGIGTDTKACEKLAKDAIGEGLNDAEILKGELENPEICKNEHQCKPASNKPEHPKFKRQK